MTDADWVVGPGEILREMVEELDISQHDLAVLAGYTQKHISRVINGHAALTVHTALRFELAFEGHPPAEFWLNLEMRYRLGLARGKLDTR